jgi:hypothetical protein
MQVKLFVQILPYSAIIIMVYALISAMEKEDVMVKDNASAYQESLHQIAHDNLSFK